MARRAHCPQCDMIVELPHDCPNPSYQPENYGQPIPKPYEGPRDDEGRPIGAAVRAGTKVSPKITKSSDENKPN